MTIAEVWHSHRLTSLNPCKQQQQELNNHIGSELNLNPYKQQQHNNRRGFT